MAYSRGSEWRVWDLHVHTPASYHWDGERFGTNSARNDELVDEMICAFNAASPAAYAIMDYWTFDGWFALKSRLEQRTGPNLEKTVFPGIELRLSAPMSSRLNAHVIFSEEINDQHLKNFLAALKLELTEQPLSKHALIEYARYVGDDKLQKHNFDPTQVGADDGVAYRAGCMIAELTVASYKEAIKGVPNGQAVGFMPFSTNDGLRSVDWEEHYAYALSLFQSSPIFETRNHDLWGAFCGVETPGNKNWIANFCAALRGVPRLAVSGSDSHRFVGKLGDNNKRGYGDFPSGKRTWIKADPTWKGLLQVLKEPAKRSYLGSTPPKMDWVQKNKTFYIDTLRIAKAPNSSIADAWLDGTEILLNPDLVAIIGNKGSGKSALADIIALLGNSQQNAHFSFLRTNRFRGKSGDPARQFVGELSWLSGEPCQMPLSENPTADKVELVRYIPQGRFEALCNDHVSGRSDAFEKELRDVVFSHLPINVRLDALSFDELIEGQENTYRAKLSELRKSLGTLNQQIVDIEDKLHPDTRSNLDELVRLKHQEIAVHNANRPADVLQPAGELTDEQQQTSIRLKQIGEELLEVEFNTKKATEVRHALGKKLRAIKNISARLELFEKQYADLVGDISEDAAVAGIKTSDLVKVEFGHAILSQHQIDYSTVEAESAEAVGRFGEVANVLLVEQRELTQRLNEPQQAYQAFTVTLKAWQLELDKIVGNETEPESLRGLEQRLVQIRQLPGVFEEKCSAREIITEKIFGVLEEQRAIRATLFAPLQQLIQNNSLIRDEYKLQFQAKLQGSSEAVSANLFSFVKQTSGELRGEDESHNAVRLRFEKFPFEQKEDAATFAKDIVSLLLDSADKVAPSVPGIRAVMRKDKDPKEVYDYVFGLQYLEPKYTLLFQDTRIEQLSPGQRGALLLIFYLLVDKGRNPIVLDQPEENLDNETVVSLLVPVLNEAKRSRQIIMVTHNPNLAVVCDAEQIIHAKFDRKNGAQITYQSGSIEDGTINRAVVDVLEGTMIAFTNRGQKYHD